jgi:hypothetical protein
VVTALDMDRRLDLGLLLAQQRTPQDDSTPNSDATAP